MKLALITFLCAVSMVSGVVFGLDTVSIFDLQYTTAADGKSPYDIQFVNCIGGVVTEIFHRSNPRIIIQDPIVRDVNIQGDDHLWSSIQVKDWTYGGLSNNVSIGDWVEFNNVPIEDSRGTTFIQYAMGGTASTFSIISSGHAVPEPLCVNIKDITSPIKDTLDPDSYYAENHNAEKYESMRIKVSKVSVVQMDVGKASDNYVLQSSENPGDSEYSCWAADYLNANVGDLYHPYIEIGEHFCDIEGVLEQYTNISGGFDYYQLLTTSTNDFLVTQTGDLDDDCDVDLIDFAVLAERWYTTCSSDPAVCLGADWIVNGVVDEDDLAEFVFNWLEGVN